MPRYKVTLNDGRQGEMEAGDDVSFFRALAELTDPVFPWWIERVECLDDGRVISPESMEWLKAIFNIARFQAQYISLGEIHTGKTPGQKVEEALGIDPIPEPAS